MHPAAGDAVYNKAPPPCRYARALNMAALNMAVVGRTATPAVAVLRRTGQRAAGNAARAAGAGFAAGAGDPDQVKIEDIV